jgi:hypothetical protein
LLGKGVVGVATRQDFIERQPQPIQPVSSCGALRSIPPANDYQGPPDVGYRSTRRVLGNPVPFRAEHSQFLIGREGEWVADEAID